MPGGIFLARACSEPGPGCCRAVPAVPGVVSTTGTTVSPASSAARAIARPKPNDVPVISQTRPAADRLGVSFSRLGLSAVGVAGGWAATRHVCGVAP